MSIEKSLERIATALEKLADKPVTAVASATGASSPTATETPPAPPATSAPVMNAAAPPPPAEPSFTTAPATALTAEQLNAILIEEFKRIGDRAPIDKAMSELGVVSVADVPAEKQQELIAKVKAIQP